MLGYLRQRYPRPENASIGENAQRPRGAMAPAGAVYHRLGPEPPGAR